MAEQDPAPRRGRLDVGHPAGAGPVVAAAQLVRLTQTGLSNVRR
jgi:hypothetical protein